MNSFSFLVLATLMISVKPQGPEIVIVSKRDAPTVDKVLKTIETAVEQAHEGIDSRLLLKAMKTIITDVDQLTTGQKVDVKAVNALILEVFEAMDSAPATSTPFDGPFWRTRKALSVTLSLLQELANKTEELEESGEPVAPALEAISRTAEAIRVIVNELVTDIENGEKQGKELTKRGFEDIKS